MSGIDLRVARAVFTAVLVLAVLYCVYAIRSTLLLVVFAVFFSYMVFPLVAAGERLLGARVPRGVIVGAAFALILGGIALALATIGQTVATEAAGLGKELPRLLDPATLAQRLPLPRFLEPLRNPLAQLLADTARNLLPQALPAAQKIGASVVTVAGGLVYMIIMPVFSFLMILQTPAIQALLREHASSPRGAFWNSLVVDLNFLLAHYVRALVLLSLASFVAYGIVLTLMGVPFGVFLAGFAGLLELIPVFGPLVAAVAILTVALFSAYPHVLWVLGFIMVYRIFQDYVLSPYLMSEAVDVPAIAIVFGLLAGDQLAGVAGIFLSVPVIAALRIIITRLRRHSGGPIKANERR
jgi:predicted PurR-regulated permease PerM